MLGPEGFVDTGRSPRTRSYLGSYRIATGPEPNSSRLTSFKSTRFDSPAIAAPVQCDVDGIPKGSHYVLLQRANLLLDGNSENLVPINYCPSPAGISKSW